jgi:hypothetical protein
MKQLGHRSLAAGTLALYRADFAGLERTCVTEIR